MKTSRKKMLLSSIAMLLVALVALGSATYAWFSMNRIVTSKDIKITSSAAKGLQITNKRGANAAAWGAEADFNEYTDVFTPISVGYSTSDATPAYGTFGTPWYVENNEKSGLHTVAGFGGTWKSDEPIPTITAVAGSGDNTGLASKKSGYFAAYEVGIKSTGEAIDTVALDAKISDAGDYARIAIIDNGTVVPSGAMSSNTILKVFGNESSPKAVTNVAGTTVTTADQKLEAIANDTTDYNNTVANNLEAPANDSANVSKGHYFTVLIWFEGEDSDCTDSNQSKAVTLDLKFHY